MAGKLPVILQTEMTECGLACLAMIARFHGHDIDLNVLRRKHLVSMTGASLKSVIAIADGLQLSSRPLRLDLDHLEKLQLPAMLHWDLNHYVVLKSIKGDQAEIVDPGVGLRKIKLSKLDAVLPRGDSSLLLALAIGFGGLVILRAAAEAVRGWAILVYGNQMSLQMVGNVFRHLIRLPARYFERRHVGDIISRMGSTLATWLIYPHLRRTQEESIYAKALENSHVIESIRAITTVKMFGREAEREAAWRNLYTDFINANVAYGKWVVTRKFFETLLSLHLDRLSDIIFEETDEDQSGDTKLTDLKGAISLKNVSFQYSTTDPMVLSDFNLDIAAGEMVTLTGPSGGGKTTLMKLMLGLYDPTAGTLQIDGQDLKDIDRSDWRSRIGVVMQEATGSLGACALSRSQCSILRRRHGKS